MENDDTTKTEHVHTDACGLAEPQKHYQELEDELISYLEAEIEELFEKNGWSCARILELSHLIQRLQDEMYRR